MVEDAWMSVPAKRNATYQDVIDAPDYAIAEIIEGDLYLSQRGSPPQARVYTNLIALLHPQLDEPRPERSRRWTFWPRGELHLCGDVLVPDFAIWRASRYSVPSGAAFANVVPDLVCEILSPFPERPVHIEQKLLRYNALGVPYIWMIDPGARMLEIKERRSDGYQVFQRVAAGVVVRAMPLDHMDLDTSLLFDVT